MRKPLPTLMVAPNGARHSKAHHPALPIAIEETVDVAKACFEAGADGLHLHVRNELGMHTLDVARYKEAISLLEKSVPQMSIQITSEAVGQYSPAQQRKVVRSVLPEAVSISIAEMLSDGDFTSASSFYQWCHEHAIAVQHILYDEKDLLSLGNLIETGILQKNDMQLLFVLGRYTRDQQSTPEDLHPFTDWMVDNNVHADWAACAFGKNEIRCLEFVLQMGGKVRVGFENSIWNADGSIAKDNAERVRSLQASIVRHTEKSQLPHRIQP